MCALKKHYSHGLEQKFQIPTLKHLPSYLCILFCLKMATPKDHIPYQPTENSFYPSRILQEKWVELIYRSDSLPWPISYILEMKLCKKELIFGSEVKYSLQLKILCG